MKPIIGLTMGHNRDESVVNDGYTKAVLAWGGIPLMLPLQIKEEEMERLITLCDGFVFTGGGDIDPKYFGEEIKEYNGEISPIRDEMEIPFMKLLAGRQKPVLGICRGAQVMNVALGGSIYQDLRAEQKQLVALDHKPKAPYDYPVHQVAITPGSLLHKTLGEKSIRVNSIHHQGFNQLGQGLSAGATAPCGLVEAIEGKNHPFFMGLQWHPEKMPEASATKSIFYAFIAACRKNNA